MAATTAGCLFGFSSPVHPSPRRFTRPLAAASNRPVSLAKCGTEPLKRLEEKKEDRERGGTARVENPYANVELAGEGERKSLKDFLEEVVDLMRLINGGDGGPPRWFSPLECGARASDSPLLLFLPGIDGTGLGLLRHHKRLGEMFEVWCLHIPVMDRTPVRDLVKFIEQTIRSESYRCPNRPIYIIGESLGAWLALDVAAHNPAIDLVLILANPATSFSNPVLQSLISLLEVMPAGLPAPLQHALSFQTDDPWRMGMDNIFKGFPLQQMVGKLSEDLLTTLSHLSVVAGYFPKETLLWKLQMLKSASASANSRLHAVKAQTLILSSGKDQWLPSQEEVERLHRALTKCETRTFNETGQFLFLDDGFDLVTVIKASCLYRRGRHHDYVSDYLPPTPSEFKNASDSYRWLLLATSPVMLSTLEDGSMVRSLAGIPSEGPVLYVSYHMLLGFDVGPLAIQFLEERNIVLRGIAHPLVFTNNNNEKPLGIQSFDAIRLMGSVPVSARNFYKLLQSKSHVLLYPGGAREALHRKGEEYKLFWPARSEFVRMAARFGAKIVPFGVVGEDDLFELIFDYNDQMRIPFLKAFIEETTSKTINLRSDEEGELSNQDMYLPGILPKLPGRFYYCFGKPIETAGRKNELSDREKAQELYLEIKSEVERCIAYLKEKRESDPYRNLIPRLLYQATHGFSSEVPTFDL